MTKADTMKTTTDHDSISGRKTFSDAQAKAGIIMYEGDDVTALAAVLKAQETHGPLCEAKDWSIIDGECLVFCAQPSPAYSALYFYVAGWGDGMMTAANLRAQA